MKEKKKFELLSKRSVTSSTISAAMTEIFGQDIDLMGMLISSGFDAGRFAREYEGIRDSVKKAEAELERHKAAYGACRMVLYYDNCKACLSLFERMKKPNYTATSYFASCRKRGMFSDILAYDANSAQQRITGIRTFLDAFSRADAYRLGYAGLSVKTVITLSVLSPARRQELLKHPVYIHNQHGDWTVAFSDSDLRYAAELIGKKAASKRRRCDVTDVRVSSYRDWAGNSQAAGKRHIENLKSLAEECKALSPKMAARLEEYGKQLDDLDFQFTLFFAACSKIATELNEISRGKKA